MEAILVSATAILFAEIGDKSQFLVLCLAARFPLLPVILGVSVATLANHGLAAWIGVLATDILEEGLVRWILGVSFLVMAAWMFIPEKADKETAPATGFGPFLATLFTFFLVEFADKTQIATIALSARFDQPFLVVMGTSLGMILASLPAILLGKTATTKIPLKLIRSLAAAIFMAMGLLILTDVGDILYQP